MWNEKKRAKNENNKVKLQKSEQTLFRTIDIILDMMVNTMKQTRNGQEMKTTQVKWCKIGQKPF